MYSFLLVFLLFSTKPTEFKPKRTFRPCLLHQSTSPKKLEARNKFQFFRSWTSISIEKIRLKVEKTPENRCRRCRERNEAWWWPPLEPSGGGGTPPGFRRSLRRWSPSSGLFQSDQKPQKNSGFKKASTSAWSNKSVPVSQSFENWTLKFRQNLNMHGYYWQGRGKL